MKKGQMEILGLLVLVVLISISLLFLLRFLLVPKETSAYEIGYKTVQSSNFHIALAKVSVCEDKIMEDIIVACCNKEQICGRDACDLLEKDVKNILDKTLPYQKYQFFVKSYNDECLSINTCGEGADLIGSGIFPIRKSYKIQFLLC